MTSSNVVAVKTYNALGFKNVQSFANSVGINISDFDENATVALGNFSKNNMLSLVGAYATFANSGIYNKPSFINRIYDKSGKIVYEKSLEQNAVLSPADAYIMTDVLVDTAKYGTAKGLNNLDFQVAAKRERSAVRTGIPTLITSRTLRRTRIFCGTATRRARKTTICRLTKPAEATLLAPCAKF